ncbi:MAG: hypothetical protein GF398_08290 [Chitinivibrionales bacterium]|nr:hypothetical protein [Chitinivibrionales bacterium]
MMRFARIAPHAGGPGIICMLLFSAAVCRGAPLLRTTVSLENGGLIITVLARELPPVKRIALTVEYDALSVDMVAATVSSALPRSAFGAQLDTAAATLTLTIVATDLICIDHETAVSVVRAPLKAGGPDRQPRLVAATAIDSSGRQFTPAIEPAAAVPRSSPRSHAFSAQENHTIYTVLGRQRGPSRASSVIVIGSGARGVRALIITTRRRRPADY